MMKLKLQTMITIPLLSLTAACGSGEFKSDAGKHSFKDTDKHIARFESPDRLTWQQPDKVVAVLKIKKGSHIADIGAGSGYFTRRLAKETGPQGSATGYDLEPGMIEYMKNDAKKLGLKNYSAEPISANNPSIGKDRFDMIFFCNTYHHIAERTGYLKKIYLSLKKSGRIVIVDYKKDSKLGPPARYKLDEKTIIKEFEGAGYKLSKKHDFLTNQYFLEFVRK